MLQAIGLRLKGNNQLNIYPCKQVVARLQEAENCQPKHSVKTPSDDYITKSPNNVYISLTKHHPVILNSMNGHDKFEVVMLQAEIFLFCIKSTLYQIFCQFVVYTKFALFAEDSLKNSFIYR